MSNEWAAKINKLSDAQKKDLTSLLDSAANVMTGGSDYSRKLNRVIGIMPLMYQNSGSITEDNNTTKDKRSALPISDTVGRSQVAELYKKIAEKTVFSLQDPERISDEFVKLARNISAQQRTDLPRFDVQTVADIGSPPHKSSLQPSRGSQIEV